MLAASLSRVVAVTLMGDGADSLEIGNPVGSAKGEGSVEAGRTAIGAPLQVWGNVVPALTLE